MNHPNGNFVFILLSDGSLQISKRILGDRKHFLRIASFAVFE